MVDLIIGIVIILLIVLALIGIVRNKKKGKSFSCGGDCSHCSGHSGETHKPEDECKL
ncbi:MAG: FeoB-associated Cys-rich membrane protein [Lachnospiraceae bacterium]